MSDSQNQTPHVNPLAYLFNFKGRIGRNKFFGGLGVIIALLICLFVAAANFMDPRGGFGLFIPLTIIFLILIAWIHSAIVVQRLRDAGHPGWQYFIFGPGPFVLLLGAEMLGSLWFAAFLAFLALIVAPALFPTKPAELIA